MAAQLGGIIPGLGARTLRNGTRTLAELDIYLDGNAGSDNNNGSLGSPVQTLDKIEAMLPDIIDHTVRVHIVAAGIYDMVQIRPRTLKAPVILYADSDVNAGVFTTSTTRVADAGTGAATLTGAFNANQFDGQFVEITSGAAIGQRRLIRNTTVTDLIPAVAFEPAPAQGDSYRVFLPAVVFNALTLPGVGQYRRWIEGGGSTVYLTEGTGPLPAYVLAGIELNGGGVRRTQFSNTTLVQYGCRYNNLFIPTPVGTTSWFCGHDGVNSATGVQARIPQEALGLPASSTWRGWGVSFGSNVPIVDDHRTRFDGIFNVTSAFVLERATVAFRGGQIRINTAGSITMRHADFLMAAANAASPVPRMQNIGAGATLSGQQGSRIVLGEGVNGAELQSAAGITLNMDGCYMSLASNVTGQSTGPVSVASYFGALVQLIGAPVFGDGAATDYDCGNGTPVNKANFAVAGTAIGFFAGANANGSCIVRTI